MVIAYSKKEGLVDVPNERKIHKKPVSRLGGVAIWSSTMLTFLLLVLLSYYPYGSLLSGILLGGSLMFLLGLVDDVYNLNAKFKLFIQIAIVTIVYLLGVKIDTIINPFGGVFELGWLSYPITLLWIVGICNAVNFIDGVDGLAGSVITVNSITLAIVSVSMTPSNSISALIAFILAGSMLAFLAYNFNPAKIFMGDSGALFAGFMLATLSIVGIMQAQSVAMWAPILILSVPIIDITFSSVRRILKGKSPFVADSEHIHHKLLKLGLSQNKAVFVLTCFAVLCGMISVLLVNDSIIKYFIYAIVLSGVMLFLNFSARK